MAVSRGSFRTAEQAMRFAVISFWNTYYSALRQAHIAAGKPLSQPVKDRNLQTTTAQHVVVFERFWGAELARALGVDPSLVGPRRVTFRSYRSKSFDVCYPRVGTPQILISIKSMQNAYRNITNRIEEALGDSTVLRVYESEAAFGFFYFVLDGKVARGQSEQGVRQGNSIPPFLDPVEEGGDFLDLTNLDAYRRAARTQGVRQTARQDEIARAELSLMDLVQAEPKRNAHVKYDAVAFLPTRIAPILVQKDASAAPVSEHIAWTCTFSQVNPLLGYGLFINRLVRTARLRGLI